jgi:SWI/SNF-related matrix-associated actin-dependent regulator 1 of chromatin subfamily A
MAADGADDGAAAGASVPALPAIFIPGGPTGWAAESAEVAVRYAHALRRGGETLAAVEALQAAVGRPGVRGDAQALAGVFAAYAKLSEQLHGLPGEAVANGAGVADNGPTDNGASPSSPSGSASSSADAARGAPAAANPAAVRAIHELAIAACPAEPSVWLSYADFEARRGGSHAMRGVFRRALALAEPEAAWEGSAASAASSGGGSKVGAGGSVPTAAAEAGGSGPGTGPAPAAAPKLPLGRLSPEASAVLYAAYVSRMDAQGPVELFIEAQEAAFSWDRQRTALGHDGIGTLASTAAVAARYAAPPSVVYAGADAAAAAAAAEAEAVAAASSGVGRKRGAAEAGMWGAAAPSASGAPPAGGSEGSAHASAAHAGDRQLAAAHAQGQPAKMPRLDDGPASSETSTASSAVAPPAPAAAAPAAAEMSGAAPTPAAAAAPAGYAGYGAVPPAAAGGHMSMQQTVAAGVPDAAPAAAAPDAATQAAYAAYYQQYAAYYGQPHPHQVQQHQQPMAAGMPGQPGMPGMPGGHPQQQQQYYAGYGGGYGYPAQ